MGFDADLQREIVNYVERAQRKPEKEREGKKSGKKNGRAKKIVKVEQDVKPEHDESSNNAAPRLESKKQKRTAPNSLSNPLILFSL